VRARASVCTCMCECVQVETLRAKIDEVTQQRWNVTDKGSSKGGSGEGKEEVDAEVVEDLRRFFEPHNERLYQLLGRRLWPPASAASAESQTSF